MNIYFVVHCGTAWFIVHCVLVHSTGSLVRKLAHLKRCRVPVPHLVPTYRTVPLCVEPFTLNILPGTGTMTATIYCK
jgi:hypothetical protein